MKGWFVGLLLAIVIGVFGITVISVWTVATHARILTLEERTEDTFVTVVTAYQKRIDGLPRFIQTVRSFPTLEKEPIAALLEAYAKTTNADAGAVTLGKPMSLRDFIMEQNALSFSLYRLITVIERHLEIKKTEPYLIVRAELRAQDEQIAAAITRFNTEAIEYNNRVGRIPSGIIAGFMGKFKKPYFEFGKDQKAPVIVRLD
ncbi:MAG: LemA family protein [Spirochaetota bacterium]